jgi:hypothetical protein
MSVRNLGRSNYTTPTELMVLQQFGLKCRPRFVVWQIAEANDLAEVLDFQRWVALGRPEYFEVSRKGKPTRFQAWQRRSPTYWLFSLVRRTELHPWPFTGTFRDGHGTEYSVRFHVSSGLTQSASGHPGWEGFSQALIQGADICRSNKIQLLLVLIPDKFRVLGDYSRFPNQVTARAAALPGLATNASLAASLVPFCNSQQIPFLDVTDELKNRAKQGQLVYLPFDTHLSPLGHEAVAELIALKLTRMIQDETPPGRN